jgi:hypothetical protein
MRAAPFAQLEVGGKNITLTWIFTAWHVRWKESKDDATERIGLVQKNIRPSQALTSRKNSKTADLPKTCQAPKPHLFHATN